MDHPRPWTRYKYRANPQWTYFCAKCGREYWNRCSGCKSKYEMGNFTDDDEYCALDKCQKHVHKIEHTGSQYYRRPRSETSYKCSRCLKQYYFKCYACQEKDDANATTPPILPWQTPYAKRNHCIDPCPNCNEYICKCFSTINVPYWKSFVCKCGYTDSETCNKCVANNVNQILRKFYNFIQTDWNNRIRNIERRLDMEWQYTATPSTIYNLPKHIIPFYPYKQNGRYKPKYWLPSLPLDFPYPLGYWRDKFPPGYWEMEFGFNPRREIGEVTPFQNWDWMWPSYPVVQYNDELLPVPEDLQEAIKYQVTSTVLQYWWDPDEFWEDYAYGLEKHKEYCREKGIPVPDDPNTQYSRANQLRKIGSTTIHPAILKRFNMSFPGGPGFPPMGGGGGGFPGMEQYEEQLRVSCTVVFDFVHINMSL